MNQHYHTPIDDLLVKHLLGETDPEEKRAVETWLNSSADNRHYYQQLQLIWEKSLHLTPSKLKETEGDEEQAWQDLRKKLNKPARPKPVIPLPWAIAAAAAILLPVLFLTFFGMPGSRPQETLVSDNKILKTTLPDGTIVTQNTHSTLTYPKKFQRRTVQLQGEAFFQVATDKARPFQLTSNGITITVLGTAFNVHTDSTVTRIAVESGRIKVANGNNSLELGAGESITLNANDRQLQAQPTPSAIHNYYHPRVFICNGTPLSQLADALQNAYGVPIVITDTTLRKQPITAAFNDESLDRIISVLKQTLSINSTQKGDTLILKK